ncbi:MAG TPA: glycosyltransferase family 39 protein, partial [Phycisphaerae bacterium]|nr:glycosyltransferase family 39 protein [Phycisphaerae bacterium]
TGAMVLRLFPLIVGISAVFLTWPIARSFAGKRSALLATALVACALQTVRYSTDFKPYSTDLLTALCLIGLGLWAIRKPNDWRPLAALALISIPAVALSYPSIFVLGSVGLSLLPQMIFKAGWRQRLIYCGFGLLSAATFGIIFYTVIRGQRNATSASMDQYWQQGFPPHNIGILWWLIKAHFTNMMSYPLGGNKGVAFIITPLCLVGVLRLAFKRRFAALALLTGPFVLTFAAAVFRAYPYGYEGRVEQHLVPSIAMLWGFGVVTLIAILIKKSRSLITWRVAPAAICAAMVLFVLICIPLDFKHPYISPGPKMVHDLVHTVFQNAGPNTQIVISKNPYRYSSEIQWDFITQPHPYRMDGQFDAAGLKNGGDLWIIDFGYSLNNNFAEQTIVTAAKMGVDLKMVNRVTYAMRVGFVLDPLVYVQALHFVPIQMLR